MPVLATVVRILGSNRKMVRHKCGTRMDHLTTYYVGGTSASDWWCHRCKEACMMWGDEDDPNQPKENES